MSGNTYRKMSLVINVILLIATLIFGAFMGFKWVEIENAPPPAEGPDLDGLAIVVIAIVLIIAAIYFAVVLLNVILKALHVRTEAWGFAIPCFILDLALAVAGAVATYSVYTDSADQMGLILFGSATVLSAVSTLANFMSVVRRDD